MTELNDLFALDDLTGATRSVVATPKQGKLYCVACGALRRMNVSSRAYPPYRSVNTIPIPPDIDAMVRVGTSFVYTCVLCNTTYTAFVYAGPEGPDLIVLPSKHGGIVTPHTPAGVRYYCDQAHRAESVGARSAAVVMFRSALEHLLFEQGFKEGTCGAKVNDLEKAIGKKTAPPWALKIEPKLLRVLKELGDAAAHPNDGDVSKQSALDSKLLQRVKTAFQLLLHEVYEEERRRTELLGDLQQALDKIPME
jgi:hypothetical protein